MRFIGKWYRIVCNYNKFLINVYIYRGYYYVFVVSASDVGDGGGGAR